MDHRAKTIPRRAFIRRAAQASAGLGLFHIVPAHVLGGPGRTPPSETLTRAVIGVGGRGGGFVLRNEPGQTPRTLAVCDVDKRRVKGALQRAGEPCQGYTDFRRVLERADIDVVYIATPPHWHAMISILAAEAGKDIYCEKPMTTFIGEGRPVIAAVERYGRIFQIGTFGRFGKQNTPLRKLMRAGLARPGKAPRLRHIQSWKVREWSGRIDQPPEPVPVDLDYDLWLGPAPFKPYFGHRTHGSFRGYWDYDGGGLADMGEHFLDGPQYELNKDATSPVDIEAHAPIAHPDACGLWGWVRMAYADGTTLVFQSQEWDNDNRQGEGEGISWPDGMPELSEDEKKRLEALPDEAPLAGRGEDGFEKAVKERRQCGGNPEAAHRCATLLHLANIAIRLGRKLRYDPVAERFPDDEEANRLAYRPTRAPWRL
jgi:predicted dehydrogenase